MGFDITATALALFLGLIFTNIALLIQATYGLLQCGL